MERKHIAIDGKTIHCGQSEKHKASHIITTYSSDMQLVLGQLCTDEKSNEITAIPCSHSNISADRLLQLQRTYWAIENNLHRMLDACICYECP